MWGLSYSGSSALAAASMQPPSLKAIVPMHGTANEYWGFLRPHGCRSGWWTEASWGPMMVLLSLLPPLARDPERRWARVWYDRLEQLQPLPFIWHSTPFEQYMGWRTDASRVEAAMYAVSGWHDYYPQATLDYFNAARGPRRVLIGGWKHEFPDLAVTGAAGFRAEMDRWWDRWLRGIDNGIDREPEVLLWHQGEDVWRYESSWPPQRSKLTTFFADAGGRLGTTTPSTAGRDDYRVDPAVGFHLLPWDPQAPVVPMPYDRAEDDHRGLCYDSDPLPDDLEIVGSPEAVICLSADQPDFPLHVALCDVAPDGHSTLICQGWGNAARLAGEPLQPGETYAIELGLYATSSRVPRGHRLRLVIAGADFPLLWPAPRNPTLALAWGPERGTVIRIPVTQSIGSAHPSPTFGPTAADFSTSWEDRHNRIVRDLTGATASFDQETRQRLILQDGSPISLLEHNLSTINRSHPEDTVMQCHQEAELDRPGDPLRVVVDTVQTQAAFHVEAGITLAGKRFYHQSWDLRLSSN
jgi:predicted acyl esterase